jgi:hypothetical protein
VNLTAQIVWHTPAQHDGWVAAAQHQHGCWGNMTSLQWLDISLRQQN